MRINQACVVAGGKGKREEGLHFFLCDDTYMGNRQGGKGRGAWVAHVVNKVFAKVSKNIFKVKIEKVWH